MSTETIIQRVESYRVKLGLLPFDEFKAEALARIDANPVWDAEQKKLMRQLERQCGRTTREALFAIAEADMRGLDLFVIGYGAYGSRALHLRVQELVDRLGIEEMHVGSSYVNRSEKTLVYVDHLVGRAARICAE